MKEFELRPLLETIIRRVLQEEGLLQKETVAPLQRLYCVCNEEWDYRYYRLRDEFSTSFDVHAIVLGSMTAEYHKRLDEVYPFTSIREVNSMHALTESDKIILPYMRRDDVIQIAQGYGMSPMASLVRKAFEAGTPVYMLPYSLDKLTGKEPKAYQDKILSYHRDILDLGIQYINSVRDLAKHP